ncbi:hypothetical protein, partial [Streptococcus danieliae]|uniref:hypothetical protein n=1 Tax=Streptococcus danieliae TaxID=747656 RepID=UPI0026ECD241
VGNTGTLAGNWRASVSSFFDMMEDNWFLEVPLKVFSVTPSIDSLYSFAIYLYIFFTLVEISRIG